MNSTDLRKSRSVTIERNSGSRAPSLPTAPPICPFGGHVTRNFRSNRLECGQSGCREIPHHFIGYSTDLVQCPDFCTRPAVCLSEDCTILVLRTSASTATVTDLRGWIVDVPLLFVDSCKARLQGGSMQVVGAHRPPSVPTISKLDCAAACKLQRNCRLPQRSDGLKQHLQQAPSSRAGLGRKSLRYVLTHPECRPYLHGSHKEKRCHCVI